MILIILCFFLMHGIIVGLIRGVFDIIGIIGGYILALKYSSELGISRILGFLLIFVGVVIVVSITGRIISKLIHYTPLGLMDRLFGGLLGFIKGVVVSFVFLIVLLLMNKGAAVDRSEIAPLILKSGVAASQVLPKKWFLWIKRVTEKKELVRWLDSWMVKWF
ncbi:MAG: CvpA family protein [candidate division WOR-3 bacterium]